MNSQKSFFDHNATTPIRPSAREAVILAIDDIGNPSSVHSFGRGARKKVETARKIIADALNVSTGQVFFNSGATEGNNTILKGFNGKRVLCSAVEHLSSIDCGIQMELIPVTPDGVVDLSELQKMVADNPPALISVMMVNNENGVIQPVSEISKIAKSVGALFHCDAVQSFGRIPFTRESIGADYITISSHKIGGTQGTGAIIVAPNTYLPKLVEGGGQEKRMRGGTENVPGISAFGAAAKEAIEQLDTYQKLSILRDKIETELLKSNAVRVYGRDTNRVSNTISCTVDGVAGETLLMAFDIEGIALSAGAACSSGTTRMSHVLTAMGVEGKPDRAPLRISLGWSSTEKDVEHFIDVWNKLRSRLFKG
jgi:cysteine desulfurase